MTIPDIAIAFIHAALTNQQVSEIIGIVRDLIPIIGTFLTGVITVMGGFLLYFQSRNQKEKVRKMEVIETKLDTGIRKVDENTEINVKALDAANNVTGKAEAAAESAKGAHEITQEMLKKFQESPLPVAIEGGAGTDPDHPLHTHRENLP